MRSLLDIHPLPTGAVSAVAESRAPSVEQLPAAKRRSSRGGQEIRDISLRIAVVTPVLGGGSATRTLEEVDVIRAASVRGHLRFWWRALYAHRYGSSQDLYKSESTLWGQAATEAGGRSKVDIRIDAYPVLDIDDSNVLPNDSRNGKATVGAYALWPARAEERANTPAVPRRRPGSRFHLTISTPLDCEAEVRNAVRAWLLFGGYGSRTRRGLGSFNVVDAPGVWLPSAASRGAISELFGSDVFASVGNAAQNVPCIPGAALHVGKAGRSAIEAWTTALEWLRTFRQGTDGGQGKRAREPGTGKLQQQRPSISNWPEADKIRHLKGKTKGHKPRHDAIPAWPRAGFGLPIIGRFQTSARDGSRCDEPGDFELHWKSSQGDHDRLASPLIVKPLALADGRFVPCALWLNRTYPQGQVVLRGVRNSDAPFDRLMAPHDTPQFSALANQQSLQAAFLDWLSTTHQTTVVAP